MRSCPAQPSLSAALELHECSSVEALERGDRQEPYKVYCLRQQVHTAVWQQPIGDSAGGRKFGRSSVSIDWRDTNRAVTHVLRLVQSIGRNGPESPPNRKREEAFRQERVGCQEDASEQRLLHSSAVVTFLRSEDGRPESALRRGPGSA